MVRAHKPIALLAILAALASCHPNQTPPPATNATQPAITGTTVPADQLPPAGDSEQIIGSFAAPTPLNKLPLPAERYRIVSRPDEIVSVLDNGLTVIARHVDSPVLAARVHVRTGGVYEGPWLGGGLSHLLEHLVAGGSCLRRTEAENRNLLQQIGNDSNAYTSQEQTVFFINTTTDNLTPAVDLLTGWVFGATITPDEYKREMQVVQRELEKGKGEPDRQFYYMLSLNRYRENPARIPVIGYQEVIQGLTRDDVYNYYKLAYQPQNMVISLAGDLPPQQMLDAVRRFSADQKPGREFDHRLPTEPQVMSPRTMVGTFPDLGEARLSLGFPTVSLDDPDLYALDLLASAMGDGNASLLVQQLRDEQHLVNAVSVYDQTPDYAPGTFAINLMLDTANIKPATQAVLQSVEQIKKEGISPQRLDRAKTQIRADRLRNLQTSEDIAASLADDFISAGDPHFSDLYVQRIAAVTPEQVQRVAQKYLDPSKLITTALLPAEDPLSANLPSAESVLRSALAGLPAATSQPATQPAATQASAADSSAVDKFTLPDGTVVLLKRVEGSPLVAINMYALGGVTDETDANNGIGNLSMRMTMRGTSHRTARQIAEFFDSIGGEMAASCGNNTWYWNASVLPGDLDRAMEVYADVVLNPSFAEAELAPMKRRMLAAIASQDADWTNQAMRFFKQEYFKDSPYRFSILGEAKNVSAFTPEQLRRWYGDHILRARRVMAVYGDIDPTHARKLVEKYMSGGPAANAYLPDLQPVAATQPADTTPTANVLRIEVKKTDQELAGIVIGYKSDSVLASPDNYPLDLADTMCSGFTYPTGYLHETLRGRGLVYVVHAFNQPGRNHSMPGAFIAYAGCDPSKVNEVVDLMLENIARLQGTPQDRVPGWFARSQQLILTTEAMDNQTASDQAGTAALNELLGLGYDYRSKVPALIKATTDAQVQAISQLRLRDVVVTICTPDPDAVTLKTGVRKYRSFPPIELTPHGVQHDAGQ